MQIFKKTLLFLVLVALTMACQRAENTPVAPATDKVDPAALSQQSGTLMGVSGEAVSGTATIKLKDEKYSLVLDNFMTNNGPDLHVYLSKEAYPSDFIDLGSLKSISGTQVYDVPGKPDFTQYKYALIHCQKYNHLFGSVLLK